jgi:type IV secretory pathway VirB10-like protein
MNSYFVRIKAEWEGQVHVERYPLLNSTGQALSFWTQTDLNKAVQRGKVKAIAIVSGIGYKLFEDGDLQFEDEGKDKKETNTKKPVEECEELKKPKKVEKFEKAEPKATKETKKEEPKPKPSVMDDLEEPTKEEPKILTGLGVIIPDRREDIENEIKRQFLTGGPEKATAIRAYLKENNEKVITSLPEEKLKELYLIIK